MRLFQVAHAAALAMLTTACAGAPPMVVPNDNTVPAGTERDGVLEVRLDARVARWQPDLTADSTLTVRAFAGPDGVPRIPGPLIRARAGQAVAVTISNGSGDSTLLVRGLPTGTDAPVSVPAGESRVVRFTPERAGTYYYWGTTAGAATIGDRTGRDGQLTGAIVVDDPDVPPDPRERIIVLTVTDILPDTTRPVEGQDDVFDLALNGRSWPNTERFEFAVGDTVRWRLINGSEIPHPMHLHGFHFRTTATGTIAGDTLRPPGEAPEVVTQLFSPGETFRMEMIPTRPGNWLFHCHMTPHVTPFPELASDAHLPDSLPHAIAAMSGLILGITVTGPDHRDDVLPPDRRWLYVQQAAGPRAADSSLPRGYVVGTGVAPAPDSVAIPGAPLVLTRGARTAITVVNRLPEATTVHWHGMELESYYDGVAGWSGAGDRIARTVAPGDSFTVVIVPPRAGTFIYHPHVDHADQLPAGMSGPLLVLEPGRRFEPATDRIFHVAEGVIDGARGAAVNGRRTFEPAHFRAGTTYRLRFVNILAADPALFSLAADSVPIPWTRHARDGADLPAALARPDATPLRLGVGSTADVLWRPERPGTAELTVFVPASETTFRIPFVVERR